MATLGQLRLHARDLSWDSGDEKAERLFTTWLNKALSKLRAAHDWSHLKATEKLTLNPEATGSALTVVQNSRLLTLTGSETFLQRYVDEKWDLVIGADAQQAFQISEVLSPQTARLAEGQEWIEASAADLTYTWSRPRYELPGGLANARKINRVVETSTRWEVTPLGQAEFELMRSDQPDFRSCPQAYTLRDGLIEFWPAPNSQRQIVEITYERHFARYSQDDPDDTVVDWPDHQIDLVQDALAVQISKWQGEDAMIPYPIAVADYQETLKLYMGEETNRQEDCLSMSPRIDTGLDRMGVRFVRTLTDEV